MSLIYDKRSQVWDAGDIARHPWVWGRQKCQSGSWLFCIRVISCLQWSYILQMYSTLTLANFSVFTSNFWKLTGPTDWNEFWIINSWLIWLLWIKQTLIPVGRSAFLFQSLGIEHLGTILFLLHNEQQSLVSAFCYIPAPLHLKVKPQPEVLQKRLYFFPVVRNRNHLQTDSESVTVFFKKWLVSAGGKELLFQFGCLNAIKCC